MDVNLLDLICCPRCGGRLTFDPVRSQESQAEDHHLICVGCQHEFPIEKGIPYLYIDDEKWRSKAVEADGWVQIHKDQGIYTPDEENPVDFQIPYYPEEPWVTVAQAFDLALDTLELTGQETVLDLGAGRGWAAKQFALRGCRVVAIDIVPDENIGLGRAWALMDNADVEFGLTIGDGENLPFFPNSFDIVYCSATLHHASNLPLFLANIKRVLKPNGRLCATSEPCLNILQDEEEMLQKHSAEELAVGINETLPKLHHYVHALTDAGLTVQMAAPSNLHPLNKRSWQTIARDLGAVWGGYTLSDPMNSVKGFISFVARRLLGIYKGVRPKQLPIVTTTADQHVQQEILTWCGGELFILATKS